MKPSLRVFFMTHHDGRLTGKLLRRARGFMDKPAPTAYGTTELDVLEQLDDLLEERVGQGAEALEDYLFENRFETRSIIVEVHPFTWHAKRPIIGKDRLSVRVTFAAAEMKTGAWRVVVPRFNWWLTLEDISIAEEVIRQGLASIFHGADAELLYDFRQEGPESIRAWSPERATRAAEHRDEDDEEVERTERPALTAVAEELVRAARRGKLPPQHIDDSAIRPVLPLVTAMPRTSLLIVGGPGVGKTSWLYQLAHRLVLMRRQNARADVPKVWRTSADRIIAGMVYLGMWQKRCLDIVKELSHEGDYLFVDHLVEVLRPQSDGSSIGEIFEPAVVSGEISLIGECTESELDRCQRMAPTLLNAMQLVRLPEPPEAQMPALLAQQLEQRRGPVKLDPPGLVELTRLLALFQRDIRFPGKAFRFLDWLDRSDGATPRTLGAAGVAKVYSKFSGLPVELISEDKPAPRGHIAEALRKGVIGQDDACSAASSVLARFKAGLNDPDKPLGALLFAGPTGVGKTELAKQLARYLFGDETRLVRVDGSEYGVAGSAQRLLASGRDVQSLAERVRQQPLSIVLVDEVEKAHPEVFDLLLGVLGEGRLSDDTGRLVDFRMTLIVLTSNLGISAHEAVGFGDEHGDNSLRAVRDHFRPEFVNRLDHVLAFRRLSLDDVRRIVDLELAKASTRLGLVRRGVTLRVSEEAKTWFAQEGYDPKMGARPLKRVIEERLVAPLAMLLSSAPDLRDREVRVDLRGSEVVVAE